MLLIFIGQDNDTFKNYCIKHVKLVQFCAGTIPPRFEGVKYLSRKSQDITIEANAKYFGNSKISLELQMNFVTIHITLVNITFCGTFKIRLRSVNDKLFKGVEVILREPQIDQLINLI